MPPPDNGNEYIPFAQLIALEKITSSTFRSKTLAYGPAKGNRTYGGHVYMQACYAAAQTVPKGMVLHSVTGYFLLAGKANERFIYTVRTIRDGGYCTRGVDVVQETNPGFCFTCICSFKRPEKPNIPSLDVQQQIDLRSDYRSVLGDKHPFDHGEMPAVDAPWFWQFSKENNGWTDPFPGLHLRKVDMDAYNKDKSGLDRKNLKYYSVIGRLPSIADDPNMHACAHLYASDRNSLFVISNNFDVGDNYSQIASLSHTVVFHCDTAELDMTDPKSSKPHWFCQEAWAGGSRHGRGLHQSRMWREDGLHIASTMQDGMMRLQREDGQGAMGFSPGGMKKQLEEQAKPKGKL